MANDKLSSFSIKKGRFLETKKISLLLLIKIGFFCLILPSQKTKSQKFILVTGK
jgi:hypothetical protein